MIGHLWVRYDETGRITWTCTRCKRQYSGWDDCPNPNEKVVHIEVHYITCEETMENDVLSDVMNT